MRCCFVSNLFPDTADPKRGLDNAELLLHLRDHLELKVLAARPTLTLSPGSSANGLHAPESHREFEPRYVPVRYVPKVGHRFNHRLFAAGLRAPLVELHRRWPIQVILCAWAYPDGCGVRLVARELGIPYVLVVQGSDIHHYMGNAVRRRLILEAVGDSRCTIARSASLAHGLGAHGGPPHLLKTLYNGVDPGLFHPAERRSVQREALGLADRPTVLFVGDLLPVKHPHLAVQAFCRYRATATDAPQMVMIGGGPLLEPVRRLVSCLGASDDIQVLGPRDQKAVADYYRASDLLLLSSRNEGLPNVILQAFASGLPVLATDVGGIAEVLDDDRLGRRVPAEDETALAEGLAACLSRPFDAGWIRNHSQRFSWQSCAAAYAALLKDAARPCA